MADDKGDLDAEIAGQKLSLKNVSINTIATVATLMVVSVLMYGGLQHVQEAREASAAFVAAIKDQTAASREQTGVMKEQVCMLRFDQADRGKQENIAFCKQITR